jgi:effector-binding domain-containing protein
MKLLKILFFILLGLAALVVGTGIFAKHDYYLERSIEIEAPRYVVLSEIKSFKNFHKWSPWNALDPNMTVTLEGPDSAVGSVYRWAGNKDVGEGFQTLKSVSDNHIEWEVTRTKPWAKAFLTKFDLEEVGKNTKVTWGFNLYIGFPWNAMAMLTDVRKLVGRDLERGLGYLKKVCENHMHKKYRGYDVVESTEPALIYAGIRDTVPMDTIQAFFAYGFSKIKDAVQKSGTVPGSRPVSLTFLWDETNKKADIAAALQIPETRKFDNNLQVFKLAGGKALEIEYFGIYDSIGSAHLAMGDYMKEKKLQVIPPVIEQYITDPKTEPDTSKWLTKVIYFIEPLPADTSKLKEKQ